MQKTYIGDGVYVQFNADRQQFILTTENGDGIPLEIIYLDVHIAHSLIEYIGRCFNKKVVFQEEERT